MKSLFTPDESYPEIHSLIREIPATGDLSRRNVHWLANSKVLGIARQPTGTIDLFIAGPPIQTAYKEIESQLEFENWYESDGTPFETSRITFPQGEHFDAIAAFVCVHLLENSILDDTQLAFSRSEAAIAVALEEVRLHDEAIVGLLGELLVLRALIRDSATDAKSVINGWLGYQRSARDYFFGTCGLEVKTTLKGRSTHHVSGLHQIEPGSLPDGGLEKCFVLVSIGLEKIISQQSANGFTLPFLVESILDALTTKPISDLEQKEIGDDLIAKIRMYGITGSGGYDHLNMKDKIRFGNIYQLNFVRSYDMTDPKVDVFHTSDLTPFTAVVVNSVSFTINLPDVVNGDINPILGLDHLVHFLVEKME
jgi:hypothetical protein